MKMVGLSEPRRSRTVPFVPFHRPHVGEEEIAAVVKTMRSGCLTLGPKTHEFQQEFAHSVGAEHAIAVNSCTAALHLALDALDLPRGAEIITSTLTFPATAAAIVHSGARPVLADVSSDTLNLDPRDVARKVTPRTKAVVPVHFAGHPASMDELNELAAEHGLKMVDDAAQALPASHRGRAIGTIGDATAFSFYATRSLTTGDGGMMTTSNADLADRMWTRRLHGVRWENGGKRGARRGYDVTYPGFKYNMTDIAAAIGLVQLRRLPALHERRREIAARYTNLLAEVPELRLPNSRPDVDHAWQCYVVRLRPEMLRVERDAVLDTLNKKGVGASVQLVPLHAHSYYRSALCLTDEDFPVASDAARTMMSLPLFALMSDDDVHYVADTLRKTLKSYRR
jgi:dTDP-4-amino-4,6-dideoxygalactose transaminase